MKDKIIKNDWSEFDKLMESLGNPAVEVPERNTPEVKIKDDLKSRLLGNDVMSDAQHKMIIAIFTNELDWRADQAFRFITKVIPELKPRLSKRIARESDIQGLYRELKKNEASKLINILKSISERKKRNG